MKEKKFTGKALESALKENSFEQVSAGTQLYGMVKQSEKEGYISFTQSGCDTWVDLPSTMIEQAEFIENRTCKDHSHPIMKITLKQSGSPEYNVLLALLGQSTVSRNNVQNVINPPDGDYASRNLMQGNYLNTGNPVFPPTNFLSARRAGGLGLLDCKINCGPCTACIPWTDICWRDYCCGLSDCRLTIP